ncbi:MAG: hypothetical protein KDD51_12670 [Bdellovibrionales bacterium]|nr:hypothetical protein [Bdellovibrionales bacterium]
MKLFVWMALVVAWSVVRAEDPGSQLLKNLNPQALKGKKPSYIRLSSDTKYLLGRSCLKYHSLPQWREIIEGALTTGTTCLKQRGSKQSLEIAAGVEGTAQLIQGKALKFLCEEEGYSWKAANPRDENLQADAVATDPDNPHFPTIHMNPRKLPRLSVEELQRILFHESIHLLGYGHFTHIEYSYSCEHCCFHSKEDSEEAQRLGCNICKGKYTGIKDPRYIDDIMQFFRKALPAHSDIRLAEAQSFMKGHRQERWAKFNVLLLSPLPDQAPFTIPYAELLEKKYVPLSEAESRVIKNIKTPENKVFAFLGGENIQHLANAFFFFYESDYKLSEKELMQAQVTDVKQVPATIRARYVNHTVPFLETIKEEVAGGLLAYYSDLEFQAVVQNDAQAQKSIYPHRQRIIRAFFPEWNPNYFPPFKRAEDGTIIVMVDDKEAIRVPASP